MFTHVTSQNKKLKVCYHFQPSLVDDGKGAVADQLFRVVLVHPDGLHGDREARDPVRTSGSGSLLTIYDSKYCIVQSIPDFKC